MTDNTMPEEDGLMPLRVWRKLLDKVLENINPSFKKLRDKLISEGKIQPGFGYIIDKEKVASPKVNSYGKIYIQETFLSYLWCNAYSFMVLYREIIVKQSKNDYFQNNNEVINQQVAEEAYRLWEYSISLIDKYSDWDKSLPNPEVFPPEREDLISKANSLFLIAFRYVHAHEFAHVELDHFNKTLSTLEEEQEADARSIELVLAGEDYNDTTLKMGVLVGLCSLLFFDSIIGGKEYPDVDNRIDDFIRTINSTDPKDEVWGMATLAYKLWDRMYKVQLVFLPGMSSPKELYHLIKRQVEERNRGGVTLTTLMGKLNTWREDAVNGVSKFIQQIPGTVDGEYHFKLKQQFRLPGSDGSLVELEEKFHTNTLAKDPISNVNPNADITRLDALLPAFDLEFQRLIDNRLNE